MAEFQQTRPAAWNEAVDGVQVVGLQSDLPRRAIIPRAVIEQAAGGIDMPHDALVDFCADHTSRVADAVRRAYGARPDDDPTVIASGEF